jgi:hypothetical protein
VLATLEAGNRQVGHDLRSPRSHFCRDEKHDKSISPTVCTCTASVADVRVPVIMLALLLRPPAVDPHAPLSMADANIWLRQARPGLQARAPSPLRTDHRQPLLPMQELASCPRNPAPSSRSRALANSRSRS